jgi:hypothetical protein
MDSASSKPLRSKMAPRGAVSVTFETRWALALGGQPVLVDGLQQPTRRHDHHSRGADEQAGR